MSAWQTGDVIVNGLSLHYTRTGGAKPPVVLAHGFTDHGLCWTPVAQVLEPEYDLIMVDARGHGHSDAPELGYGPVDHANDLAGVIAALELQRPAVLGHSMGAVTALTLAGLYPDLPGAILLEDPPPWWVQEPPSPTDNEERAAWMAQTVEQKDKTRAQLIAEQHAKFPTWSQAELGPWADSKLLFSLNVLHIADAGLAESVDWETVLGSIRIPVLLMTADLDLGAILAEEAIAILKAWMPQMQVEHISGAGHSIRREQFERYMQVVRDFLRWKMTGSSNLS